MKRLHFFGAVLWLGIALSPARAAPPSYQNDLYANPERPLPMQPSWQLRPAGVDGDAPPWNDIFVFKPGMTPELMERSRWLSLNPGENAERAPGLLDTLDGRALFLSPAARSFCDGRWQAAWLESIGGNAALQPTFKVWLVEQRGQGNRPRTTIGYGRVDAQGRWAVPPVRCDGQDTASENSPASLSYPMPDEFVHAESDLRVDTVAGQPGLRDARGRWRTAPPERDVATAQWMRYRRESFSPGSTGMGLVDVQGRMVIPFVFNELPDATARRRIRLCTAAGQERQLSADTQPLCRWQRLHGGDTGVALQPAKDPGTGRWGYQDAQGRWAIAPQFQSARPFRHGYAVVSGLFPDDWRPPGWQDSRPIVRRFLRAGRHWVAEAMVRNTSTGGRWAIRFGVLNDAGQWLAPVPDPTLQVAVLFPPGGRSSHYAGMLARHLPNLLGRSVQVDHVPKDTEADYRRLVTEGGNAKVLLAAMRLPRGGIEGVHKGPPIDALLHSLRPVTLLASQPLVLAIDSVKADTLGIHSTDDLLAYARAHPGSLRIGTGEDGWTGHLAFGQFRALSGVDVQRVVFKGMYPDSDVITKEHAVDLLFAPVNGVAVAVRRGQLRVLGTTADAAHPQSFDGTTWPTLASSTSLAGYAAYDGFSLWAPADSDAASNRTLQEAVAQVLAKPEVRQQLQDLQAVGGGGSPEDLLSLEQEERVRWERALSAPASPPAR